MKYTLGNSRLEVNGKQYLKDVGGYNGTNKDSSKDVATVIGGKIDSMINVTYSQLVDMRNNGKLIPGQQYRITDYVTTTIQENTESAGHQFDIIVTANSNNMLSEIAGACLHEGDIYFSGNNANLSAWQIWYCLDNDNSRFEWATTGHSYDSDNQLYEFDNWVTAVGKVCDDQIDAFYETEINEKFSHFNYTENLDGIIVPTLYGRDLNGDVDEGLAKAIPYHYKGVYNVDGVYYDGWAQLYISDNGVKIYAKDKNDNSVYILTERIVANYGNGDIIKSGKGVIYRMIDEWGNDCPYDFKNIKFTKPIIISEMNTPDANLYYTFCSYDGNSSNIKDASISGKNYSVYNNVIKPHYSYYSSDHKQSLNRILFIGSIFNIFSNTFSVNCYNNIFSSTCNSNTFGTFCDHNTFGDNCSRNTFGEYCTYNTFGNQCFSNTFGSKCNINKFGDNCDNNTFGDNCNSNTFGDNCDYNTFGANCSYNTFGNECSSNKFGNWCGKFTLDDITYNGNEFQNWCKNNVFGDYCGENNFNTNCQSNTLGQYCYSNTFGNYCCGNTFGNKCESNTFNLYCYYNTFGNNCESNKFGNRCDSSTFGNKCSGNTFGSDSTNNTFGNYCQYNTFGDNCDYNKLCDGCRNNIFGTRSINGEITKRSNYRNIIFDNGNCYICLNCEQAGNGIFYQNVRIGLGVNNTSVYKTITDTNYNQDYETLYRPTNSKTLNK